MKRNFHLVVKITLLVLALIIWLWIYSQAFSAAVNLSIIIGGVVLVFPIVWLGRTILIGSRPRTGRFGSPHSSITGWRFPLARLSSAR